MSNLLPPVFPFTIYADRLSGQSPYKFRDAMLTSKPKDITSWYAFDVVVLGREDVRFVLYDMEDAYYGGIGPVIAEFTARVSPDLTKKAIGSRIRYLAEERREIELADIEEAIIKGYAEEIEASLEQGDAS